MNINGFSAEINAPIITGKCLEYQLIEILKFRDLRIKEIDFSFIEPELSFTMNNDRLEDNNILVSGEIINVQYKSSACVDFQFNTDLKLIDNFIKGIKQILKEYPSRYK